MSMQDILDKVKGLASQLNAGTDVTALKDEIVKFIKALRREDITALVAAIDTKRAAILDPVGGVRAKLTDAQDKELGDLGDAKEQLTGAELKAAMEGDVGNAALAMFDRLLPLLAKVSPLLMAL